MRTPEYTPVPHHVDKFANDASVVGIEPLSNKHIAEVVVNEDAVDLLGKDFKFLASVDFLVQSAQVTVPESTRFKKRVAVSHGWRRALPLGYGEIPYQGIVGTTVMSKGGWISGSAHQDMQALHIANGSPWGFFGDRDAQREIDISHLLLSHEFRSALTLGYVIFEEEAYGKTLKKYWKKVKFAPNIIDQGFLLLGQNRQHPAQVFRLTGVSERVAPGYKVISSHDGNMRQEYGRAARSLITHSQWFPRQFIHFLKDPMDLGGTLVALNKLGERMKLNHIDFRHISELGIGMVIQNSYALTEPYQKASDLFHGDKLDPKNLAQSKDINVLDYIYQDYEDVLLSHTFARDDSPTSFRIAYQYQMMTAHAINMSNLIRLFSGLEPEDMTYKSLMQTYAAHNVGDELDARMGYKNT